jgi:hypothetical protein
MLEDYLAGLELGYFEVGEAFAGLTNENIWKRPAPELLSVGELAGHLANWEAVRMAYDGEAEGARPDLAKCKVKSLLVDPQFAYYPSTLAVTPTDKHRTLTAPQVHREFLRVHEESMSCLKALAPDLNTRAPWWHSDYAEYLRYAAFHVAYHTGQMYSVRHLLGDPAPDN